MSISLLSSSKEIFCYFNGLQSFTWCPVLRVFTWCVNCVFKFLSWSWNNVMCIMSSIKCYLKFHFVSNSILEAFRFQSSVCINFSTQCDHAHNQLVSQSAHMSIIHSISKYRIFCFFSNLFFHCLWFDEQKKHWRRKEFDSITNIRIHHNIYGARGKVNKNNS